MSRPELTKEEETKALHALWLMGRMMNGLPKKDAKALWGKLGKCSVKSVHLAFEALKQAGDNPLEISSFYPSMDIGRFANLNPNARRVHLCKRCTSPLILRPKKYCRVLYKDWWHDVTNRDVVCIRCQHVFAWSGRINLSMDEVSEKQMRALEAIWNLGEVNNDGN